MSQLMLDNYNHQIANQLAQAVDKQTLSHAYLFEAIQHDQASKTALFLAAYMFCEATDKPCKKCSQCQRVLNYNHPDVFLIQSDKQTIGVDEVRELKSELSKTPIEGEQRLFIIDCAQKLTQPAENAILNILEEPASDVVIVMIAPNRKQLLPTILSRLQIIEFDQQVAQSDWADRLSLVQASDKALLLALQNAGIEFEQLAEFNELENFFHEVKDLLAQIIVRNQSAYIKFQTIIKPMVTTPSMQEVFFKSLMILATEKLEKQQEVSALSLISALIEVSRRRQFNVNFDSLVDYLFIQTIFAPYQGRA